MKAKEVKARRLGSIARNAAIAYLVLGRTGEDRKRFIAATDPSIIETYKAIFENGWLSAEVFHGIERKSK